MPDIDLRDKTGRRLKPEAPIIVLAWMLFPRDRQARHRWIALVGKQGRGRAEENVLRRVQGRAQPGALAGNALVCLIQLRRAGIDPSRAAVTRMLQASPEACRQVPMGPEWHVWIAAPKLRVHPATLRRAMDEFAPVAHLWAAYVLEAAGDGWEDDSGDSPPLPGPGTNETLPHFLAIAGAIASEGSKVMLRGKKGRRRAMDPQIGCRFILPACACRIVEDPIPPLSTEARTAATRTRP